MAWHLRPPPYSVPIAGIGEAPAHHDAPSRILICASSGCLATASQKVDSTSGGSRLAQSLVSFPYSGRLRRRTSAFHASWTPPCCVGSGPPPRARPSEVLKLAAPFSAAVADVSRKALIRNGKNGSAAAASGSPPPAAGRKERPASPAPMKPPVAPAGRSARAG